MLAPRILLGAGTALFLSLSLVSVPAASAGDVEPTGGYYPDGKGVDPEPDPVPLAGPWIAIQAEKAEQADRVWKRKASSYNLGARQRPQTTSYYCGPAMVAQVLAHKSMPSSQSGLADQLNTTVSGGTAWYGVMADVTPPDGRTNRPVPDVLNYWFRNLGFKYLPVDHATPSSSGSSIVSTFKRYVVADIYGSRTAVAANALEPRNGTGPRLVGHPRYITIYHWYSIYAYSNDGDTMRLEDPASSPAVTWGNNVPKTSEKSAYHLAVINGERGYVW